MADFTEQVSVQPWTIQRIVADPVVIFGSDPFDGFDCSRLVRVHTVTRPAIVLGAGQRDEVVDASAAEATGIAVVRRRSGGGAVWLDATSVSWLDVVIGVDDPLWQADVGRAFWCRARCHRNDGGPALRF